MIQIPGPLSFRLMIFSFISIVAAFVLGPVAGILGGIFGVGGILLNVAAITCGLYELKNQPQQKLFSMLGVSLSATAIVLLVLFMVIGALSSSSSGPEDGAYSRTDYR